MNFETLDQLAEDAHQGQRRAQGTPYIDHPRAVRELAEDLARALDLGEGAVREAGATALLHDVIEDSPHTEASLSEVAGEKVAARVALLSKRPGSATKEERNRAYWATLEGSDDDLARLVKIADRVHNLLELPLTGDLHKIEHKLNETRGPVRSVAASARSAPLRRALGAVLDDAIALCARSAGLLPAHPLPHPRGLYAIVGGGPDLAPPTLREQARRVVQGGAQVVQLRLKDVDDRKLLHLARELVDEVGGRAWVVINDRADIALAAGAHGVHVGLEDLPPGPCRQVLGGRALVGASSHTLAELEAQTAGGHLDYVAAGPVFSSRTKQGHAEELGLEELARLCAASPRPLCAIGGIDDPERAAACARAGAGMVAVVSALARAEDPRWMARRLHVAHLAAAAAREEDL